MTRNHHALLAALLAFLGGMLFLRQPGFGDDFTYWWQAFAVHENGLAAWDAKSFHDLRWPVWGPIWVFQAIFGAGLTAYWSLPLLYLALGCALAFIFTEKTTRSTPLGWTAAAAFFLNPMLDSVCWRPMPDLSEGVLGALTVLVWWRMLRAETTRAALGWTALGGLLIFILEANRVTGVFIGLVLAVLTLWLHRRRFGWVVLMGLFAGIFFGLEACFYRWLFGDWLHALHANMGATGKKGTEAIALWSLPFRFLDSIWKAGRTGPLWSLLALVGIAVAWRKHARLGRILVGWTVLLYLCYACAPQSLSPWRPMLRDADRFLCGLTVPMAVLAAIGIGWLCENIRLRWPRLAAIGDNRPRLRGALIAALLVLVGEREFFKPGIIADFRAFAREVPAGTRVFTHEAMRAYAFLIAGHEVKKLQFSSRRQILARDETLEEMAGNADQFWYLRKLLLLTARKKSETDDLSRPPATGSYIAEPDLDWHLSRVFVMGDSPDIVIYRSRQPADAVPAQLTLKNLAPTAPALPFTWAPKTSPRDTTHTVPIPENLRGQLVRAEVELACDDTEPVTARIRFLGPRGEELEILLKPYAFSAGSRENFVFPIPAAADRAEVVLSFSKKTKSLEIRSLHFAVTPPEK